VLQQVAHRVCCGLFKEYSDEWQQQQQLYRRKELDLSEMSPYFVERAQVRGLVLYALARGAVLRLIPLLRPCCIKCLSYISHHL
jgi:hypothetical protein